MVRHMLWDHCLSCLSVCNISVLWPNGWMEQDATWYGGRPQPRRHCVRLGTSSHHGKGRPSSPHRKGHNSLPHFSAHVYCVAKRSPISATSELLLVSVVLSMTVVGIWWCSGNVNNFHRNGEYSVVTTMQ